MAQTSYFWNGTTVGDASLAPYNAAEYADIFEKIAGNFVIPGETMGYSGALPGDELAIKASGSVGRVIVYPGAAMVRGVLYTLNTTKTITVPSTATANPAIYRIVLYKDVATQTVRAELRQGADAVNPAPPAVASTEISIAWLWVDGAYNAAADIFPITQVHDERVFKYIGPETISHIFHNTLPNPQFIATSGGNNAAPDGWILVNTPFITYTDVASTALSPRGRVAQFLGDGGEGIETTVPINRGSSSQSSIWTLRGQISVTVGLIHVYVYGRVLGGAATLITQKTFGPMSAYTSAGSITEFVIRSYISATYDAITVRILCQDASTAAYITGLALTPGYLPGTRETVWKSELIWLDNPLTDAAWTATAKSTGTTTVSLSASFTGYLPTGIRGIVARIACRDSGSAAAIGLNTSVSLYSFRGAALSSSYDTAVVSCAGKPNDTWETGIGYVAIDQGDTSIQFGVRVLASGAGTLDATIEIIGIIT